jgi:hypothetical protein
VVKVLLLRELRIATGGVVLMFLALDGNGQLHENLNVFQQTVGIELNIPGVPPKLKLMPQG